MPLVEIKYFNAFYFNPFFDQPVESKQEACEKLIEMSRNDDYRTGNLLDYSYHTNILQQINFVGKVEEKKIFYRCKTAKSYSKLFLRFFNCNRININNGTLKILNLLNEANNSKLATIKQNIVNDNLKANYDVGNEIIYSTEVLKSNLYNQNNAYILVRGSVTIIGLQATQVAFKNSTPFRKYITKIDATTKDDAEDLDLAMPMYNLIGYCSNYSETTGGLWFYSKDEVTDFYADIANDNNFKSFKYKYKLLGNTQSNFQMPLINCMVELKHKCTKYCVLSAAGVDNVNGIDDDNNIVFTIKDTKLYVPL